jgi:hypothetical protein
VTPEDFLAEHDGHFAWSVPDGIPAGLGLTPVAAFTGRGNHALEVALATVSKRPRADEMRKAWTVRYGKAPNPLLLVGAYQDDGSWRASICGPVGDEPPVESDLELGEVERIAAAALSEPSRHAAIRFLASIWSELEHELPGGASRTITTRCLWMFSGPFSADATSSGRSSSAPSLRPGG